MPGWTVNARRCSCSARSRGATPRDRMPASAPAQPVIRPLGDSHCSATRPAVDEQRQPMAAPRRRTTELTHLCRFRSARRARRRDEEARVACRREHHACADRPGSAAPPRQLDPPEHPAATSRSAAGVVSDRSPVDATMVSAAPAARVETADATAQSPRPAPQEKHDNDERRRGLPRWRRPGDRRARSGDGG